VYTVQPTDTTTDNNPTTLSIYITTSGIQNSNATITTYSTSANSYTYFRMIITSTFGYVLGGCHISKWTPKFNILQTATSRILLSMDSSNINQLDISGSLNLVNPNISMITVSPNSAGSTIGNTWINNNITWRASYSSIDSTYNTMYNWNNVNFRPWASAGTYTAGNYTGTINTTNVTQNTTSGVTINGEYMQIQSSTPLILKNYSLNTYGWANIATPQSLLDRMPGKYYIVGSNDGTNWVSIQDASFTIAPTSQAVSSSNLFTQSYSVSTIAPASGTFVKTQTNNYTITYYVASNSYTYFRLIVNKTIYGLQLATGVTNNNGSTTNFGWNPNFTYPSGSAPTVSSNVPLVLDNAAINQLNVGGSLGITNGITPLYLTPSIGVGQIGYSYISYIPKDIAITATPSINLTSISNILPGIWLVNYMCAFTNFANTPANYPVRIKTFVGTTNGGVDILGIHILQVISYDISSATNSIVCNTASTNTFYLNVFTNTSQTCSTFADGNTKPFLQVTRIA
jgi:hypothetical protein